MATADKLAEEFMKLMDGEAIPDIGIGLTQALSIFLAYCELDHEGGAESARNLFLNGIKNLSNATLIDVQRMRNSGMTTEQIREELRTFIPLSAKYVRNMKSGTPN